MPESLVKAVRTRLWVPKDDQAILGTREGHIEPAGIAQEANALVFIGSHTRKNDVVLLAALEGIHAAHLHLHDRLTCKYVRATVCACAMPGVLMR